MRTGDETRAAILGRTADVGIVALASIWLLGGIPWGGKRVLGHGPDLFRAALLLGGFAWLRAGDSSIVVRWVARGWGALASGRARWALLAAVASAWVVLGALRALAMRYPLYDVGIFHQAIWGFANGHGFVATISGAGDMLRDHLSPTLALLAPLFWIADSALWLPLAHAVLLATGVAAWVWLAERLPRGADQPPNRSIAVAALLVGASLDSLWGNLDWGFHESSIAFACLSWGVAIGIARGGPESAFSLEPSVAALFTLAAFTKEIYLLDVGGFLLLLAVLPRTQGGWLSRILLATSGAALLAAFVAFELEPKPADKNYFARYFAAGGPREFLEGAWSNPRAFLAALPWAGALRYLAGISLPCLGLFVFSGPRWPLLALGLPSFLATALSTYEPMRNIGYHYALELWPVLIPLSIVGLARVAREIRSAPAIWVFGSLLLFSHDPWESLRTHAREALAEAPARRMLSEIPPGDSVSATELAGPWVAGRERAWRIPEGDADWIVLRIDEPAPPGREPRSSAGSFRIFGRR